jgi:integrase
MRQGLGYKYHHQTRRLTDFVTFMEKRKATTITTKLAMEWATLPPDRHATWALRLTDVRGFARHVANIEPKTEVPPAGILPGLKRAKPYVYSDAEIDALLAAALALPPEDGLRRWTYHYLFGLIAVTGMRLSEAIGLQRDDVDLEAGLLTVRLAKFGKSRLVPLHPTTRAALRSYADRRAAHLGSRCSTYFFVAERGGRLLHQYVHLVFWRLSREIGLRRPGDRTGPRVHDFRHRFGALIQRVLAIPSKRHDKRQVHFLPRPEIEAILAAPDRTTWLGRRDHTLLLLAAQTGLRLSELIGLDKDAIHLGIGAHVRCVGNGRKERFTPLTTHARVALQAWLKEPARRGANVLFPNVHGGRLSADSVQSFLAKHVRVVYGLFNLRNDESVHKEQEKVGA